MKRISITSMQMLVIDEHTGTCFIEDDRYREVLHIYLPDLIRELIAVNNKHNPDDGDHFESGANQTLLDEVNRLNGENEKLQNEIEQYIAKEWGEDL